MDKIFFVFSQVQFSSHDSIMGKLCVNYYAFQLSNKACLMILNKLLSQMFPMALVCGNTMVLKPSERNPGACMFIMKLAQEAGIPEGCVNVIHGSVNRNYVSIMF